MKRHKYLKYLLMAERADGTGRMIYAAGNNKAELEELARKRTTPRTRYWVEDAPPRARGD